MKEKRLYNSFKKKWINEKKIDSWENLNQNKGVKLKIFFQITQTKIKYWGKSINI